MTTSPPLVADVVALFPSGTSVDPDGCLLIGGSRVDDLATAFGTPAYLVDEAAVRRQATRYRTGLAQRWPDSVVAFASKAFPCTAIYRLMAEEGLSIDVAGGGELMMALASGADPSTFILHGNAKTDSELELADRHGVGLVVIDNFNDIDRLERIATSRQAVLIRVIPDVTAHTHDAMVTGQRESKFGLSPADVATAIRRVGASRHLRLDGLHVHIGSEIHETKVFESAVEAVAGYGDFPVYDLGGGLGVRHTYDEHPPSVENYLDALVDAARAHLPRDARLIIEPGRSLVAESGVTLYRVVTVKRGERTFVAVDGGMGDNLEVSLYGQRFEAAVATRPDGKELCDVVGHHCESGDLLVRDVPLATPEVGDLIAVPATGAYCYTMANNYNGALKPPVVFCRDGAPRLVVRRETYDDLLRRDLP